MQKLTTIDASTDGITILPPVGTQNFQFKD